MKKISSQYDTSNAGLLAAVGRIMAEEPFRREKFSERSTPWRPLNGLRSVSCSHTQEAAGDAR